MQNQSNSLITFDTQLKTALKKFETIEKETPSTYPFCRRRSNKREIKRASAWGEQKIREKWGGGEREGGEGGEERNRHQQEPMTRSLQLYCVRVTAFSQTDLFLD